MLIAWFFACVGPETSPAESPDQQARQWVSSWQPDAAGRPFSRSGELRATVLGGDVRLEARRGGASFDWAPRPDGEALDWQIADDGLVAPVDGGTAWLRNRGLGFEFGVDVDRPAKDLRVDLGPAIGTVLSAGWWPIDGLRAEAPRAFDAVGRSLPAAYAVVEGRVAIEVDAATAAFPVVVDPLFTADFATLEPNPAVTGGWFGQAVAVDGNWVVVGQPGDLADAPSDGLVSVYLRGADGELAFVETLTAPAGALGFGAALALHDDRLVIGAHLTSSGTGEAYLYRRDGDGFVLEGDLSPPGLAVGDLFGRSVAVGGDAIAVGAPGSDVGVADAGAVYLVDDGGGLIAEVTAADGASGDGFGIAVSATPERIAVGASGRSGFSGGAYLFARNVGGPDGWGEEKAFDPPLGVVAGDRFGDAIALEGADLLVGAPKSNAGAGSAHLYGRDVGGGGAWGSRAEFVAADPSAALSFGESVALGDGVAVVSGTGTDGAGFGLTAIFERDVGGDEAWGRVQELAGGASGDDVFVVAAVAVSGDLIVRGDAREDSGGRAEAGRVQAYRREATTWDLVATADAIDPLTGMNFGFALAAEADRLAVGCPLDDEGGGASGSVFLYAREEGGLDGWELVERILSPSPEVGAEFGFAVALDGGHLLVGAPFDDQVGAINGGAAWLFDQSLGGLDSWDVRREVSPDVDEANQNFGHAVALAEGRAFVGAPRADDFGADAGEVHTFERNQGGSDTWGRTGRLVPSDAGAGDRFGDALAADGVRVAVGASTRDAPTADVGGVYIYVWDGAFSQEAVLLAAESGLDDEFGSAVALSDETLVVGLHRDDTVAIDGGLVTVWSLASGAWARSGTLPTAGLVEGEEQGFSVAMAHGRILAGHPGVYANRGRAVLYESVGGSWVQVAELADGAGEPLDRFGRTLVAESDDLFITALYADQAVADQGRVFIATAGAALAPVAEDDALETPEDVAIALPAPGVLANDWDGNGDLLTATMGAGPEHGTAVVLSSGAISYDPDPDFVGEDGFDVVVTDSTGLTATSRVTVSVAALADAPVAVDDGFAGDEDTVVVGNVLSNDVDVDGDLLEAALVDPPSGDLVLGTDGAFTYVPPPHFSGADEFTYVAGDGLAWSAPATVRIALAPVDDVPLAVSDAYGATEDVVLNVGAAAGVLANDMDADLDPLGVMLVTPPTRGVLALATNGAFTYTPNPDASGVDTFSYIAVGAGVSSPAANVVITVSAVDDGPVWLAPVVGPGLEDETLLVAAPGAKAWFSDAEGEPFTVTLVSTEAWLDVTVAPDGTFSATPDPDANGVGVTRLRACDGPLCTTADLSLTFGAVDDAPRLIGALGPFAVAEEGELDIAAPGVLGAYLDVDLDPLTASLVSPASFGTVAVGAGGGLTYAPDADHVGADGFVVTACDAGGCGPDLAVSVITGGVNDPPVGVGPLAFDVVEDETATFGAPGLLAGFTDPEGDPLSIQLASPPAFGLVAVALGEDGAFDVIPEPDAEGVDSFTVRACDPLVCSAPLVVTVDVLGVNDLPRPVGEAEATFEEDVGGTLLKDDLIALFVDVEGDLMSLSVASSDGGTAVVDGAGSVAFAPDADRVGAASVDVAACDAEGCGLSARVVLELTPVPDVPRRLASQVALDGVEDTPFVLEAPGVAASFEEVDGDPLGFVVVVEPAHGDVVVDPDGAFTYTPGPDETGLVAFEVEACDADGCAPSVVVEIDLAAVNDVPRALVSSTNVAGVEDVTLVLGDLGVHFEDPEGDDVSTVTVVPPAHGSVLFGLYLPHADYNGADEFQIVGCDAGGCATEPVTVFVVVQPSSDPTTLVSPLPDVTTDEDVPVELPLAGMEGAFHDKDGLPLVVSITLPPDPAFGTWDGLTFAPARDVFGVFTVGVMACEEGGGSCSTTATFDVVVEAVDDAPRVVGAAQFAGTEDVAISGDLSGSVTDPEGDPVDFEAVGAAGPGLASVLVAPDGSFLAAPVADHHGGATFVARGCGAAGCSAEFDVLLDFAAVDDAPRASPDGPYVGAEGETLVVDVAMGVLANDFEPDGDPMAALLVTPPSWGTVELQADGSFTYVAFDEDWWGQDEFGVVATDALGSSGLVDVTVVLQAVDDPPRAVETERFAVGTEDLEVVLAPWLDAFTDPEGDPMAPLIRTLPAGWVGSIEPDGSARLTPAADANGLATVVVGACDRDDVSACGAELVVHVDLAPVDDAPRRLPDVGIVAVEDASVALDPDLWFTDVDGDDIRLESVTTPLGSVVADGDGLRLDLTPDAFGDGTLTVVACGAVCGPAVDLPLTVLAMPDAPIAVDDAFVGLEDAAMAIVAPGPLANDVDPDGDPISAVGLDLPEGWLGTLLSDGQLDLVPPVDWTGTTLIPYSVTDGSATSWGAISVSLTPTEDPTVVAASWSYATDEDVPLVDPAPGAGQAFMDADGPVEVSVAVAPAHGTFDVDDDGTVTWEPDADFFGADVVGIVGTESGIVSDVLWVDLTVHPVDDPPKAVTTWLEGVEDTVLDFDLGVLFFDPEGTDVHFVLTASPVAGGDVSVDPEGVGRLTPWPDAVGPVLFTVAASDAGGLVSSVDIMVELAAEDDEPRPSPDMFEATEDVPLFVDVPGVLGNDVEVDGEGLVAEVLDGPAHGVLDLLGDGSFSWVPAENDASSVSFTYVVSDGLSVVGPVEVDIVMVAVDDPPFAVDDTFDVQESTPLFVAAPGVLANDGDVEGDGLVARLVDPPVNGILTLGLDGSVEYVPDPAFVGVDHASYVADAAGQTSGLAWIEFLVGPAERPPVAADDAFEVAEDVELSVAAPGVLGNDLDPEGLSLTAELATSPALGSVELSPDGAFIYYGDPDVHGADAFSVRIVDAAGLSVTSVVWIDIFPVNDAPVALGDSYRADAGISLAVGVDEGLLINDVDVDGDTLTAVLVSPPAGGSLTLGPDGSFTYVPTAGFSGVDGFSYAAFDGALQSNPVVVTVDVAPLPEDTAATDGCDDPQTWYHDYDGDGYGTPRSPLLACDEPDAYVTNRDDCDDLDDAVHPDATEIPNDGADQDCDGEDTEIRASGSCTCDSVGGGGPAWVVILLACAARRSGRGRPVPARNGRREAHELR